MRLLIWLAWRVFNPLTGTLKSQSNEPLYSATVISTLVVDWWYVTFGTASWDLGGLRSLPSPLLAVPNVTAHPSSTSVPTSYYLMWHHDYLCTLKGSWSLISLMEVTRSLAIADKPRDAGLYSCWSMAGLFVSIWRQKFAYICYRRLIRHEWIYYAWQQKLCNLQQLKNRSFHVPQPTFLFLLETPNATITQCVAWMERQFNACQILRSMYLSIFNSFRVIRCLSQCVSPKIAIFTFWFPLGMPLGQSRWVLYGWKEDSMLTNCLAACAHLTITVSEIQRDIGGKSSFFHTPLALDAC